MRHTRWHTHSHKQVPVWVINIQGRNSHPLRGRNTGFCALSLSSLGFFDACHLSVLLFFTFLLLFSTACLPVSCLRLIAVWELRQAQKSGWHYVGHIFAATGENSLHPSRWNSQRRREWMILEWKRRKTEVKSRKRWLWGRLRKWQEKMFFLNLVLRVPLTRSHLPVSPSLALRPPCCVFSISLTSVPPSPTCCGNIFFFFICCLQRVALSLEDDGYPWGVANVRRTLPSSHHNLYITTRRATRHRRDIERRVLTLTPYLRNRDEFFFHVSSSGITTLAWLLAVFMVSVTLLSSLCLFISCSGV